MYPAARSLFVALLPIAGLPLRAQEPPAHPVADLHAPFQEILAKHVRDERVDYLAVRDQESEKLTRYLDALAKVDPAKLGRNDRLAFYLNLYNATMIHAVSERFVAGWDPESSGFGIFKESIVGLNGKKVSLDHIENEIVRPQFKEPRIHAALVCGARSCPPILPRAYRGEDLDETLESNFRRFVRDGDRNRIDGKKLQLSQLFNWFAADFGKDQKAVLQYVSKYAGKDLTGREVSYLDYSWKLNQAAPKKRYVTVQGKRSLVVGDGQRIPLRDREVLEVLGQDGDSLRVRAPKDAGEGTLSKKLVRPFSVAR